MIRNTDIDIIIIYFKVKVWPDIDDPIKRDINWQKQQFDALVL